MESGSHSPNSVADPTPCVLIIFRRPPFGSVMAVEGLRMAEALLAFQVPLKVVFAEEGVFSLLKGQGKGDLCLGDLGKAFAGLEAMGLPQLMVVKEDLESRKLATKDLVEAPIMKINACHLRKLIDEAKVVIPF
jgi:sulfur relay protein TusC/DsrF